MAKPKIIYACQSCGYQSPKWLGRCPDCNQWNTFAEEKYEKAAHPRGELSLGTREAPAPIHEIDTAEDGRVLSGIGEFDRVLGRRAGSQAPSFSSAATRASGNRHYCCRPSPPSVKRVSLASMFPAKNPSDKSRCARNGSALQHRTCSF